MLTILWTVLTTKEYSPEERRAMGFEEDSETHSLSDIFKDFSAMPVAMKQLGVVQFCSWIALFSMWVYSTPAIAHHIYGTAIDDHSSKAYQDAGNQVGYIFSIYNGVSAIYALMLPTIAAKIGKKLTHAISLACGGLGLISIYFVQNPEILPYCMIGVGMAWASIFSDALCTFSGCNSVKENGSIYGDF